MALDVFQQIFSLSLAANRASDCKGTQTALQAFLQSDLLSRLPEIDPEWQLVWGPVVWKHEPHNAETGLDNAWYIAFHPRFQFEDGTVHPTYVIALAGTPGGSMYVWFTQDLEVNNVVDFNAWVARGIKNRPKATPRGDVVDGNAYIALGTVKTVHLLLTTPAPSGAISAGTTLLDFITNLDKSASPGFISTGHSLGGTLSPCLALALVLAGSAPADDTLTYPTAGASPGNTSFTDLFVKTFPARKSSKVGYKGWNLNLVNTLDVVPQAWCSFSAISTAQNLDNIPFIYGKPALDEVLTTTSLAVNYSRSSHVRYKPLPSQYFTGTPPPAPPTNLQEFNKLFGQQHVGAYLKEVGIGRIQQDKSTIIHHGLREKTETEILSSYPFAVDFVWALEHPKEVQEVGKKLGALRE